MGKADLLSSFSSEWVKFDNYEYREDNEGNLYICPTKDTKLAIYKAFDVKNDLLSDILNIGRMIKDGKILEQANEQPLLDMVMVFVRKYGLLGLMNYFPYNERFLNQNKVLLPEQNMISHKELLSAKEYVQEFIPFATKDTFEIHVNGNNVFIDHKGELPVTAFIEKPLPFEIMFSRHYCEKLDWFIAYADEIYRYFNTINAFYSDNRNAQSEQIKEICKGFIDTFSARGMSFGLKLHEKAKIEWDFNSLRSAIDTIFGFMVGGGDDCPIKACKHDGVIFYAKNPKAEFCSSQCRNQFNVYKSRSKKE